MCRNFSMWHFYLKIREIALCIDDHIWLQVQTFSVIYWMTVKQQRAYSSWYNDDKASATVQWMTRYMYLRLWFWNDGIFCSMRWKIWYKLKNKAYLKWWNTTSHIKTVGKCLLISSLMFLQENSQMEILNTCLICFKIQG